MIKVQCIELRPANTPQTEKIGDILYLDPETIFDDCGEWYGEMYKKNSEEILIKHGVYKLNRFHRIAALRPVSRERMERMRGEWMFKPFYKGTSRGAIECQECKGAFEGSVGFNFCPNCGAPMTDESVDMVMERLEELYEKT